MRGFQKSITLCVKAPGSVQKVYGGGGRLGKETDCNNKTPESDHS